MYQKRALVQPTSFDLIPIKSQNETKVYMHAIAQQIHKLNNTSNFEQKKLALANIKKLDEEYIKSLNKEIVGQVLLSRHGECNAFEQKKWGINPNTGLSEASKRNMQLTSNYTKELLHYPDEPLKVHISPLLRALETATYLLPKDKPRNITIDAALSENSSAPSGFDVRSVDDLETVLQKTAWYSSTYYLFNLSKWLYKDAFDEINLKRKNALETLEVPLENDVQALNYQEDKIEDTIETIKTTKPHSDAWLIGHGKNFKALYKDVFQISSKFDFAETRRMYKLNNRTLFNPPYSFVINQKTGQLEGAFTGTLKLAKPILNPLLAKPKTNEARLKRFKMLHRIALVGLFTIAGLVIGILLTTGNVGLSAAVVIPFFLILGFIIGIAFVKLLDYLLKPTIFPPKPVYPLPEDNESEIYPKEEKKQENSFQYSPLFQQPEEELNIGLSDSEESENELKVIL